MRVIIGLASLAISAAAVEAQLVATGAPAGAAAAIFSTIAVAPLPNPPALCGFSLANAVTLASLASTINPLIPSSAPVAANSWGVTVPNTVSSIQFTVTTNAYAAQLQYRWSPNYNPANGFPGQSPALTPGSYTCDPCAGGTPISCSTQVGPGYTNSPGTSPANGFACAGLTRLYVFSNLVSTSINQLSIQVFDRSSPLPVTSSYLFGVTRQLALIAGDPQIVGLQGQDFQVHGIPDEVFNMITYPNLQVNARFAYLSAGECLDNYTACFAHPGTYISEEGIRVGSDKVHVRAGAAKKGLTVSVNGQRVSSKTSLKLGSVEFINHRRVVIKTPIMALEITNSDKFLNQAMSLFDRKLLALGAERRVLGANELFHSEVPLHGLQGQTWRNVEYPSGLDYEGSISDYHVTDGNLFGSEFVFNQYEQ